MPGNNCTDVNWCRSPLSLPEAHYVFLHLHQSPLASYQDGAGCVYSQYPLHYLLGTDNACRNEGGYYSIPCWKLTTFPNQLEWLACLLWRPQLACHNHESFHDYPSTQDHLSHLSFHSNPNQQTCNGSEWRDSGHARSSMTSSSAADLAAKLRDVLPTGPELHAVSWNRIWDPCSRYRSAPLIIIND